MGGKSSPPPANTTTSTTTSPWSKAQPFLLGTKGQPGLFPEAAKAFQQYQTLTPERSQLMADYDPVLRDRYTDIRNFAYGKGGEVIQGGYDPRYQAQPGRTAGMERFDPATAGMGGNREGWVDPFTAGMGGNREGWVDPSQVDMTQARQGLGVLDPTQSMQRILSGQIDNPYLAGIHQAAITPGFRAYEDALQGLTQSVLPQLGGQAFAAGGYGGSRQGIAEGLALQQATRGARDLGISAMDVGQQLYGGAYQSAQDRMAQATQGLSTQAADIGQFNVSQLQGADAANAAAYNQTMQFNAQQQQQSDATNAAAYNQMMQFNAQQQQQSAAANAASFNAMQEANAQRLQQADQYAGDLDLQQQAARLQNLQAGQGIFQDAFSASDNIFNQLQSIYGAPQQQYLDALNQYASIISPGAGLGGSQTGSSQVPIYSGSGLGQIIGGAGSIAGLLGSLR